MLSVKTFPIKIKRGFISLKKFCFFIFVLILSVPALADELGDRTQLLDEALQKQEYSKILTILYPQLIQKGAQLSEAENNHDLYWLSSKTELGHVPLYYFLSWKLMKSNLSESRKLNAKGRIGVMLDANECIRAPQYSPFYIALEGRLIQNNMLLREDEAAWTVAVNDALVWYQNHPNTPSASWRCGNNNLLTPEGAKAARVAYWQKIKVSNDAKSHHN